MKGVIALDGMKCFAEYEVHAGGLRLRVRAAEWQVLGFGEGQAVGVRLPDKAEVTYLVNHVHAAGGQVVASLVPPVANKSRR
jgi:hypothetical protein